MKKGKSIFLSKTFWVNLIGAGAMIYAIWHPDFIVNEQQIAFALAIINVLLRAITGKPIVW